MIYFDSLRVQVRFKRYKYNDESRIIYVCVYILCRGEMWGELNSRPRAKTAGIQYKRRTLFENVGGRGSDEQLEQQ